MVKNALRLRYVQTCIKSRFGMGTRPITIQFYAPMPSIPTKPGAYAGIKYDFRAMGEEIAMIRAGDDYGYCIKQCLKMCYFAQKMHNVEILKMRCEFAKDDHGTIWFLYASQIFKRDAWGLKDDKQSLKMVPYINRAHQRKLQQELDLHRKM